MKPRQATAISYLLLLGGSRLVHTNLAVVALTNCRAADSILMIYHGTWMSRRHAMGTAVNRKLSQLGRAFPPERPSNDAESSTIGPVEIDVCSHIVLATASMPLLGPDQP